MTTLTTVGGKLKLLLMLAVLLSFATASFATGSVSTTPADDLVSAMSGPVTNAFYVAAAVAVAALTFSWVRKFLNRGK